VLLIPVLHSLFIVLTSAVVTLWFPPPEHARGAGARPGQERVDGGGLIAAGMPGAGARDSRSRSCAPGLRMPSMPDTCRPPPLMHLCRVPQVRAAVAALIHAEFWSDVPGASADGMAGRLAQAAGTDALPLCRVALDGEAPVGVANLIEYDDPNPRVGRPWLAGVVVVPAWRGRGLGARLVRAVLDDARRLGEAAVFLGTDGPDFYRRLGAVEHQRLRPDFWLMRFDLP
jgi:predicted N-acetyltransferase YhbS